MTEEQITKMAEKFCAWKLPKDFAPDGAIDFADPKPPYKSHWWPTGTNLLTVKQAKEMVRHMVSE